MNRPLRAGASPAFSLVEVVLALGVTTFCLVALVGLLSVGLTSNRGTIEQAGATAVLSATVADIYATPRGRTTTTQFSIALPATPNVVAAPTKLFFNGTGGFSTTLQSGSIYQLLVTPLAATAPGTANPAHVATFLDVKVIWPPSGTPAGTAETFVGMNRN